MATRTERAVRGLYAITPEEPDTERLAAMVEAALAGGARLLQYRNKSGGPQLRRAQVQRLQALCRSYAVPLIVNDDLELAAEIGADGVHVGREDAEATAARARLPQALIGVSCYNEIERAIAAKRAGADYVAFGRFFASSTKPGAIRASVALAAQAKRLLGLPVVAIGGITAQNAAPLVAAGIDALAVVAGVFEARDIRAAARSFASLYE